jgi:hypothetical protein
MPGRNKAKDFLKDLGWARVCLSAGKIPTAMRVAACE